MRWRNDRRTFFDHPCNELFSTSTQWALVANYDPWWRTYSLATAVRILVVDDFEPWRRFLRCFLQEDPTWQIICEASDGLEAIEKGRELQPDLILLDIGLPKLNGIAAAREIRKIAPRSRILFFSENCCPAVVREALSAGGSGYVVKSDAASDLLPSLKAIMQNQQFVSSSVPPGSTRG
jgi:DNA-binding NarL/FixJ family response regulator